MKSDSVAVGDRMRISVALLRELYDAPDHRSLLVELKDVVVEPDGSKTLWLSNVNRLCNCALRWLHCPDSCEGGVLNEK